jgi:hypothetical protein
VIRLDNGFWWIADGIVFEVVPRPPHHRNFAYGLGYDETPENDGYFERNRTKAKKLSLAIPSI